MSYYLRETMNRSPLVVILTTVFIDLVGFGIVIPVLPFYAEGTKFNATPRTVGLLFASYSIMQLIFSPILGSLSDRYGRRPVLLLSRTAAYACLNKVIVAELTSTIRNILRKSSF